MITDMTVGSPSKILLKYCIPMMISSAFQQMYNLADSIIAGNFAGRNALAAVGASYPITMIFVAIATGLSVGCTVVISRYFGANDFANMKTSIFTSIITALTTGAVLTVIGIIGCNPMLRLLQTDSVIMVDSAIYLEVYVAGLLFLFLYNICTGVLLALGDSKTPLYFLIASSVGNIVLDYVFVANFHMGVSGVAWATFICQGICSILVLIVLLCRIRKIKVEEAYAKYSPEMLKTISRIAVPSILQHSFVSVGNLFIQSVINSFGVDATAGYSAAIKLNTFAITNFSTMGNSISSFTSQNFGAQKPDRIKKGYRTGMLIVGLSVVPYVLLYCLFGSQFVSLFLDSGNSDNAAAIRIGTQFLTIVSPFYLLVAIKLVTDGILRGLGRMKAFLVATFADLILRVAGAYILTAVMGSITGVWWSWPVGWLIGSGISVWYYSRIKWQKLAL